MRILTLVIVAVSVFCLGCSSDESDNLEEGPAPDQVAEPLEPNEVLPAGEITDFLWKPEADGGYNTGLLVVLVNPCDVKVLVNGEELIDFGPGNGRCTTARSVTKSGCDYGLNVQVQVLDRATGAPYLFPGGLDTFIVANGCNRTEFKI